MFGYLLKNERIDKMPIIEQLKVRKKDPYTFREEFIDIMNLTG